MLIFLLLKKIVFVNALWTGLRFEQPSSTGFLNLSEIEKYMIIDGCEGRLHG